MAAVGASARCEAAIKDQNLVGARHGLDALPAAQWVALAALVAVLLAAIPAIPVMMGLPESVPYGHDLDFHLARIDSVTQCLSEGAFPARLYPRMAFGMGYPCGVCYPDMLLYPSAALRLAGVPLTVCYAALVALGGLLTSAVAIPSFARMSGSRSVGLAGATIWALSPYRLFDVLVRASVGEWLAMAFMPLALCGAWLLREAGERPGSHCAYIPLGVGVAGIMHTHVLSVPLTMPLLFAVALQGLAEGPAPVRSQLREAARAIVLGCVLSLAFVVPFASFYTTSDLGVKGVMNRPVQYALGLDQLLASFMPFRAIIDSSMPSGGLPHEVGLALLAALPAGVVALVAPGARDGEDGRAEGVSGVVVTALLAIACLLATTAAIPWDACGTDGPVGKVMTAAGAIQFPWRLVGQSTLCLVALWAFAARRGGRVVGVAVVAAMAVALVEGIYATGSYASLMVAYGGYDSPTQSHVSNGEYLPTEICKSRKMMEGPIMDGPEPDAQGLSAEMSDVSSQRFVARVDDGGGSGGEVRLPVLWHNELRLTARPDGGARDLDEERHDGSEMSMHDGHGIVTLQVPAGFHGEAEIEFVEPVAWRAAELATATGLVALPCLLALERIRRAGVRG